MFGYIIKYIIKIFELSCVYWIVHNTQFLNVHHEHLLPGIQYMLEQLNGQPM